MVASVLMGPALLGAVAPGVQAQLFPADAKSTLYVLSTIGLTFYTFLVGVLFGPRPGHRGERA